MPKIIFSKD